MKKQPILIVDDDDDIRELLKYNLEKEGYPAATAATGEEAIAASNNTVPQMIILDLMLPGVDGLEVCRRLKGNTKTSHIPILMLSAKGEESDIVAGLELGADDYITKPFSTKVLIARMRTVLRRRAKQASDDTSTIHVHDIVINPGRHEVLVKGKQVQLTATEFGILHVLARRPGWVFTRYQIIDAIRGVGYPVTDRSVDVQVVNLRKKLGPAGAYVETVRGIGYRFKD